MTVIGIIVLFFGFNLATLYAYIYSLYFANSVAVIVSLGYVIRYLGRIKICSFKDYSEVFVNLIKFGFLNQMAHITQMMSFRLSYYVLEAYHGVTAVGVYSNGIQLAESIWLISKSIAVVQYARIANTADQKYAASLTVKLIKISLVISFFFLLPLLILPASVYAFVFGSDFYAVKTIILALSPGVVFYNVSLITGHYFSGIGKYWVNAMVSSIGLIFSVIFYYSLIPSYGYMGASYATSLSYCFTSILIFILFLYKSNTRLSEMLISGKEDYVFIRDEFFKTFKKIKH